MEDDDFLPPASQALHRDKNNKYLQCTQVSKTLMITWIHSSVSPAQSMQLSPRRSVGATQFAQLGSGPRLSVRASRSAPLGPRLSVRASLSLSLPLSLSLSLPLSLAIYN